LTTLGIIGAGQVGRAVAHLAVNAGYRVVISNSRGPSTLRGLVAELGSWAKAGSPAESATAGEAVVLAIPVRSYRQLRSLPLQDTIVIDAGNYRPQRDGMIPILHSRETTSSELLQHELPAATIVKALNNIHAELLLLLARPVGSLDRSALPIAGDDRSAKELVSGLLDWLGYDAYDAGSLAEGWRYAPGQPAHGIYAVPAEGPEVAGRVVSVEMLQAALASAMSASTSSSTCSTKLSTCAQPSGSER
jgi:8-hydroxy-5-deazaflavin:NADPH oxidoreductase